MSEIKQHHPVFNNMEDDMQDSPVFDMNTFPTMQVDMPLRCNRTSSVNAQDYEYLSARDEIDSVRRELTELHENLLKMSIRAHVLEVDLATQFNPDTILDIKKVEMSCQKCMQVVDETTVQSDTENSQENETFHEGNGNVKLECVIKDQ